MKYTQFVTHSNEVMGGEKCDAYGLKEISEYDNAMIGQKLADHSYILRVMGHLLGKVLTTVEATTSDQKQCKAIKDLMRGHFSDEMEFTASMMYDQNEVNKAAEEAMEGLPDDEIIAVSIDEVLGLEKED